MKEIELKLNTKEEIGAIKPLNGGNLAPASYHAMTAFGEIVRYPKRLKMVSNDENI